MPRGGPPTGTARAGVAGVGRRGAEARAVAAANLYHAAREDLQTQQQAVPDIAATLATMAELYEQGVAVPISVVHRAKFARLTADDLADESAGREGPERRGGVVTGRE